MYSWGRVDKHDNYQINGKILLFFNIIPASCLVRDILLNAKNCLVNYLHLN